MCLSGLYGSNNIELLKTQQYYLIQEMQIVKNTTILFDPIIYDPLIVLNNNRIKKENVKLITFSFL